MAKLCCLVYSTKMYLIPTYSGITTTIGIDITPKKIVQYHGYSCLSILNMLLFTFQLMSSLMCMMIVWIIPQSAVRGVCEVPGRYGTHFSDWWTTGRREFGTHCYCYTLYPLSLFLSLSLSLSLSHSLTHTLFTHICHMFLNHQLIKFPPFHQIAHWVSPSYRASGPVPGTPVSSASQGPAWLCCDGTDARPGWNSARTR